MLSPLGVDRLWSNKSTAYPFFIHHGDAEITKKEKQRSKIFLCAFRGVHFFT